MNRDIITESLNDAGVEIGRFCQSDDPNGINQMAPKLDRRWCDHCRQHEITVVLYDDVFGGMVAWAELVHVYHPELLALGGVA